MLSIKTRCILFKIASAYVREVMSSFSEFAFKNVAVNDIELKRFLMLAFSEKGKPEYKLML